MTKKILIATGGTGGHIYPAIALAQQIKREIPNSQVLFAGGGLADNRYFDRNAFTWKSISCGAFTNKHPMALLKNCSNIGKGIYQSINIIREFRPDVAIGFGSFYSFPPLVAAKILSIPLILHEANSIPGKVNRLLSRYAAVSAVHFPQTLSMLKGNTIEVGMPLREEFIHSKYTKKEAKLHFGLNPDLPTLLIFGGSQGAQIINTSVCEAINQVQHIRTKQHLSPLQVIHLTGKSDSIEHIKKFYSEHHTPALVKSFETQMSIAWQAADIVISRSGAGTIAEELEFEVPGILIPFAAAADNHQEHNANFMVKQVGGASLLLESQLTVQSLTDAIKDLLSEDRLAIMRQAMHNYKQTARTRDLCSVVKEVINKK